MSAYIQAENLKYRHTLLRSLTILLPFASVFFAAWLTHEYFTVDSYNWWYMGLCPGMLAIVCGIIGGKDKRKKNLTIVSLPCDMGRIWDAKVLLAAALSIAAMLCITVFTIAAREVMESILHLSFEVPSTSFVLHPTIKAQVTAGLLIWLTTLWQIPFCLLLAQKAGPFVMFLIHMGSYIVQAALFSLKPWFPVFPGAVTARLMCPILGILPNGLPAVEGQMTYTPELVEMGNLLTGIPAALLWFALLWLLGRKWFERQVNRA